MDNTESLQNSATTARQFSELLQELRLESPAELRDDPQRRAQARNRIVQTERRDLYYITIRPEDPPVRLVAMEYPPGHLRVVQVEVYNLQYTGMLPGELQAIEKWLNATGVLETLQEQTPDPPHAGR